MNKYKKVWELFLTFFRIGAFTFGGGYAMIPLIQTETVEKKKWISDNDILEIVVIAESTPGPIAINSATFVGYKVAGVLGSVAATLGVVVPSFVVILLISAVLREFSDYRIVKYAFEGIRAGVLALVLKSLLKMYKQVPKKVFSYIVLSLAFVAAAFTDINIIIVIAICALLGVIYSLFIAGRVKK